MSQRLPIEYAHGQRNPGRIPWPGPHACWEVGLACFVIQNSRALSGETFS